MKLDEKAQDANGEGFVWKDRKRFLGLPLSFTRYSIRNNRLYVSKGFFSIVENEILLYRILDLKLVKKFTQRIFGVGTVILYTGDETDKELHLLKIKKPAAVRDLISRLVEEERSRIGIKGKELYGVSGELLENQQ